MELNLLDWSIIIGLLFFYAIFGIWYSRTKEQTSSEYFLSGRTMSWWLLGVSLVATTFSADTPNLVTNIVRKTGIAGNWQWWAFLITGMTTVFIFSILWRRSKMLTDLEFYELRYGGKSAAFLRGFRAVYLGFLFNVMIMAAVTLALIKISAILLGTSPIYTIMLAGFVTLVYSSLGGLKAVIITDAIQFLVAIVGSFAAAIYLLGLPEIGGISGLLSSPLVAEKISFFPNFDNNDMLISLFIIPIAVQWWSVWYPGAEPGGGGYVAQRILSAKDEKNALGAVLFFNIAHYALRPWPWILVALASLIIYPDVESLQQAFPDIDPAILKDDSAYPAMIRLVPNGLLGILLASLIAAYMSTIATHLNWGASYLVNDFYKRFFRPDASEKKLVRSGRIITVVLMVTQSVIALTLENALQAFNILLSIGAGTGLIFILRWFWWRINAFTEISGMIISFIIALILNFSDINLNENYKLVLSVGITTIGWLLVTFLTKPVEDKVLLNFHSKILPYGSGWAQFRKKHNLPEPTTSGYFLQQITSVFLGVFSVYFMLFGSGYILFDRVILGISLCLLGVGFMYLIFRRLNSTFSNEKK